MCNKTLGEVATGLESVENSKAQTDKKAQQHRGTFSYNVVNFNARGIISASPNPQ
jgi:hypothetical protein